MKTLIVRICRLEKENPFKLVGVVEEVGVKGRKGFIDYDELWEILKSSTFTFSPRRQERRGKRKTINRKGGSRKAKI
jgi:hypothetical protein